MHGPHGVWGILYSAKHTDAGHSWIATCVIVFSLYPYPQLSIHCLTATMPALTVTLSANGDGSALGASGGVGWVFGLGGVGLVIVASHIGLGMI